MHQPLSAWTRCIRISALPRLVLHLCCFLKACDWPQDDFTCSGLIFVVDLCCCPRSFQSPFSVTLPGIMEHSLQRCVPCFGHWDWTSEKDCCWFFFFFIFLLPSILLLPPHLILLYVYPIRKLHTELVRRLMTARLFFPETLSHVSHDLSSFCMTPCVAMTSKCMVSIAILPLNVF